MRKTITLEVDEADLEAWKAAANGPLSKWMRKALNDAVALSVQPGAVSRVPAEGFDPGPGAMDIRAMIAEAVSTALATKGVQTEQPSGYVPPVLPEVPFGAKTIPIDPELMEKNRHRGMVASFLRVRGAEWKFAGPNPCEFGCQVRPDVLAEFANQLEPLRQEMARLERMGLEPGTIIT